MRVYACVFVRLCVVCACVRVCVCVDMVNAIPELFMHTQYSSILNEGRLTKCSYTSTLLLKRGGYNAAIDAVRGAWGARGDGKVENDDRRVLGGDVASPLRRRQPREGCIPGGHRGVVLLRTDSRDGSLFRGRAGHASNDGWGAANRGHATCTEGGRGDEMTLIL